MIKTDELADLIRDKCDIKVDDANKGKIAFSKEDMLLIIAKLNQLEVHISNIKPNKDLVKEVVGLTMQHMKENNNHEH